MKKMTLALAIVSAFAAVSTAQAADVTAQALATWSATAKKDTTSKLVVTPIGSLTFNYAEGIKGFNSQKGLFDVTVEGDTTATAFKLTSKLVSNTLTQLDTSGSTLEVGVNYNGAAVEKTAETTMIDTTAGILGGNLSALSNAPARRINSPSASSARRQTAPPPLRISARCRKVSGAATSASSSTRPGLPNPPNDLHLAGGRPPAIYRSSTPVEYRNDTLFSRRHPDVNAAAAGFGSRCG